MATYSTRQAAKRLGLPSTTLAQYIAAKKVPAPRPVKIGDVHLRAWKEEDVERVRQILPKIANGRKTRYQKQKRRQKKKQT